MTAGFDDTQAVNDQTASQAGGQSPTNVTPAPTRPGPLPPRVEPRPTGGYPQVPGPRPTGGYPQVSGPALTGPALTGPALTGPALTGPQVAGATWPGPPMGPPPQPPIPPISGGLLPGPGGPIAGPTPARGRRAFSAVVCVLLLMLIVAVIIEGVTLRQTNHRLDDTRRAAAAAQAQASAQADTLAKRIKALEQQAASSLDSTAVADAVLPSVFRVDAGQYTGTAFAFGAAPDEGGTNLVTNYHVIAHVYEGGSDKAALERDSQRFPVKIILVDKENDLAVLHSTQKFPRLAPVGAPVKSGAPVVVVGAPLGLAQSVTTGVVSATRDDIPGENGKTYIQFSAPINPGNSGGPVVDAQHKVIGVATAKASDAEGIGLAIPIKVACESFDTLC